MHAPELPPDIEVLVDELAAMPGVVSVVLGGSRAAGEGDAGSDWDLGVYYRGTPDLAALARHGAVHPPGSWGRIMNGGAWLTVGDRKVDVLLRDIDVVAHWSARAQAGEYEVDLLLGYLAGIPTYTLLAEATIAVALRGTPPSGAEFPAALAAACAARWPFHRDFALEHARMRARRGDVVGTVGQAARAVIEAAHAVLCERCTWVLNEKRIVERAGFTRAPALFRRVPDGDGLVAWLASFQAALAEDQATHTSAI
ncbi:MAG TPA: nucleotidyltransferase domain-containing protein [Kofleriaceae bacterium]|nr:nucleotidyltransferase domain-containing protein [Kofleriaceae bacterium]